MEHYSIKEKFMTNPEFYANFIDKVVEIKTNSNTYKGTVYTIDPVTESYVLVNKEDGKKETNDISMNIVMGHNIKSVSLLDEPGVKHNIQMFNKSSQNEDGIEQKLLKVKNWLEKNLIPFEMLDDKIYVLNTLWIHPPYRIENIRCINETVLQRITALLEQMPKE